MLSLPVLRCELSASCQDLDDSFFGFQWSDVLLPMISCSLRLLRYECDILVLFYCGSYTNIAISFIVHQLMVLFIAVAQVSTNQTQTYQKNLPCKGTRSSVPRLRFSRRPPKTFNGGVVEWLRHSVANLGRSSVLSSRPTGRTFLPQANSQLSCSSFRGR